MANYQQFISLESKNIKNIENEVNVNELNANKKRKQKKRRQGYQYGFWTSQQQYIYYKEIIENFEKFQDPIHKKITRIFKILADKMKTRLPQQIRTHHQKMMKRYGTLQKLVKGLQKQLMGFKIPDKIIKKQIWSNQQFFEDSTQLNKPLIMHQTDDEITMRQFLQYDQFQNNNYTNDQYSKNINSTEDNYQYFFLESQYDS